MHNIEVTLLGIYTLHIDITSSAAEQKLEPTNKNFRKHLFCFFSGMNCLKKQLKIDKPVGMIFPSLQSYIPRSKKQNKNLAIETYTIYFSMSCEYK